MEPKVVKPNVVLAVTLDSEGCIKITKYEGFPQLIGAPLPSSEHLRTLFSAELVRQQLMRTAALALERKQQIAEMKAADQKRRSEAKAHRQKARRKK